MTESATHPALRAAVPVRRQRAVRLLLLPMLLIASLLLSGCMTLHVGYDFAADGSVTRSIIVGMDAELLDAIESGELGEEMTTDDLFAEIRNSPDIPEGSIINDWEDPETGRRGVDVITPFESLEAFEAYTLSDAIQEGEQVQLIRDGNTVTFVAYLEPDSSSSSEELTEAEREQAEAFLNLLGFDVAYSVTVPGEIIDWGPDEGVEWVLLEDGRWQATWWLEQLASATEVWVTWVQE